MAKNRYGLSRHIPAEVQHAVRVRSKFGCVICRCAIYVYEHIDPLFSDAKEHNPDNICLLCGSCHDKVTRKHISKETVRRSYDIVQSSSEIKKPFSEFDTESSKIVIRFGDSSFENSKSIINIDGVDILRIDYPEEGFGFPK